MTDHNTKKKHGESTHNRFCNPYNFVRPIDQKRPELKETGSILGSVPPPPHDRYCGLSGRITCTLTAQTPLFIADSHDVIAHKCGNKNNRKEHFSHRFFQFNGEPAIPATSLRGMIRSVFETITNSCFGVFDGERRLEYRQHPSYANKLKAGIILSLPNDEQPTGRVAILAHATVGSYYDQNSGKNVIDPTKWQTGDQCWAKIRQGQSNNLIVQELHKNKEDLSSIVGGGERIVKGYIKITGNNITTKRNEYLFFVDSKQLQQRTFGKEIVREHNTVLEGQCRDDRLELKPKSCKLVKSSMVWVDVNPDGRTVDRICHVRIPRVPYASSLEKFLNNGLGHLIHCKEYDRLCPACRVFGWTTPEKPEEKKFKGDRKNGYAGRVRFSHAKVETTKKLESGELTLAILGAPKPTTTHFYLADKEGRPKPDVNYNSNTARLRGRKMYLHHKNISPVEYTRAPAVKPIIDNQSRTVCGALDKGATFSFEVEFENLAREELGALLYALRLEENLHHRLGQARPLGFGSVTISLDSVECIDWSKHFQSLAEDAGWYAIDAGRQKEHTEAFLDLMKEIYKNKFSHMLADFRAILSGPEDDLPIHYPRTGKMPHRDGKNFEWFVGNKKRKPKEQQVLPLANDDHGLPLLDNKGNLR